MIDPDLSCGEELRRDAVRGASLYGLDYVEVGDDQLTLHVVFLGKAPPKIEKGNTRLAGGRRIRDIRVTGLTVKRQPDPTLDDSMEVTVDKPGDFSFYTLSVVKLDGQGHPTDEPMDGFDPRYDEVSFTFKAGCPSDLDCKAPPVCPPPKRTQPDINYLAKDYQSFHQLILDRLALIMPEWQETHAPDLGIALVELLAYTGDYLSYYQDAVATEAYLGTARQRISVRRHARLVDYAMHEGCNARAWVTIQTDTDLPPLDPRQTSDSAFYFITSFPGAPDRHVLQEVSDLANVPPGSYEVCEPVVEDPLQPIQIYAAHSEIYFYTWGDCECCLAQGATSATLVDPWVPPPNASTGTPALKAATPSDGPPGTVRALNLHVGDVLIFEEVIGPKTGNHADADPKHRQAVRLTKVTPAIDPLYHQEEWPAYGQPIVEIEWCSEDALNFPLCISVQAPPPDCSCGKEKISVARGNVILVDSGGTTGEPLGTVPTQSMTEVCPTECEPALTVTLPGQFRPTLKGKPLTFSEPLPPCGCASALIVQDPRQALPQISLKTIPPAPKCPESDPSPCQIPPLFSFDDLDDPTGLAGRLKHSSNPATQFLDAQLSPATRQSLFDWDGTSPLPGLLRTALMTDLSALLDTWYPRRDLLESGPDDTDFVVEMDNDGYAHLRFGDGELGRMLEAGSAFQATYRMGNGPAGNVGAETIAYLVLRKEKLSGASVVPRNPLPATGGTAPEPLAEVKLFAPYAFRTVLERAITADDYATLAADNARRLEERPALMATGTVSDICFTPFRKVQGSKGTLRWTGSWYEMLVAIDPVSTEQADSELLAEIAAYLAPYRRMGHDLMVAGARYVSLDLAMSVCVLPHYLRGHVEAVLLDVFSNRVLPDGRLGFFHPDNLTFGEGIYLSRIVAVAQAVPGVQNVEITRLERYEISESPLGVEAPEEELPLHGILALGPLEIARLDNDPNFPENGRLLLDLRGGR